MIARFPVLPLGLSAVLRAAFALTVLVTHWLKELMRARRHRREARMLAGLDRRMLADIGITRSDVNDAFSEPFWHDPTALLRERANERRANRPPQRRPSPAPRPSAPGAAFAQPAHRRALPML